MQNFLNTALGSYLKVLLAMVLAIVLKDIESGKTLMDILHKSNLNTYGTILLSGLIPIIINALNPKDLRYGKKPKPKDFETKTDKPTN